MKEPGKKAQFWTGDFIIVSLLMAILFLTYFLMLTFITEYTITVYSVGQSKAWLCLRFPQEPLAL